MTMCRFRFLKSLGIAILNLADKVLQGILSSLWSPIKIKNKMFELILQYYCILIRSSTIKIDEWNQKEKRSKLLLKKILKKKTSFTKWVFVEHLWYYSRTEKIHFWRTFCKHMWDYHLNAGHTRINSNAILKSSCKRSKKE